ncbi:hypothetical protein IMG5_007370 [Ichthyophthirius multifiliis]|uniref:Uncharacterized protein n=1 Tax=Ichthyophthirius multifiliis TaxID=5932 RepID=G0QJP5_ICHMU|nr:hypothetical protein IMG5_007370 [Ichthyophthirius multifiliis]EGR34559.1 hypothetical protein IMG5_007370 [Ichthyophthirius multifiliis]|eukprot:XP_004039863.1 hypothetical protein IMG5_007370 [Ichthyophthirius multifiliis]
MKNFNNKKNNVQALSAQNLKNQKQKQQKIIMDIKCAKQLYKIQFLNKFKNKKILFLVQNQDQRLSILIKENHFMNFLQSLGLFKQKKKKPVKKMAIQNKIQKQEISKKMKKNKKYLTLTQFYNQQIYIIHQIQTQVPHLQKQHMKHLIYTQRNTKVKKILIKFKIILDMVQYIHQKKMKINFLYKIYYNNLQKEVKRNLYVLQKLRKGINKINVFAQILIYQKNKNIFKLKNLNKSIILQLQKTQIIKFIFNI